MAAHDAADDADADTAAARTVTDAYAKPSPEFAGAGAGAGAAATNGGADEEAGGCSSGTSSDDVDANADAAYRMSPFQTQLYTLAYLIVFSFPGALARVGLQALTDYRNAPVAIGSLWPNFGGCLVMGFLAEDCVLFRPGPLAAADHHDHQVNKEAGPAAKRAHLAAKKTIPLYIGLTTGFCGSFTTFSAFARDMFLALANSAGPSHPHRSGGDSFMAVLAVILLTVFLSLGGFVFGAHLAQLLASVAPPASPGTPNRASRHHHRLRRAADRLAVVLGLGLWLGSVLMVALPPDRHRGNTWRGKITFTLVFSPLGTLLRYGLALGLNSRVASFPLGTFAANIGGTLLVALFWDLAHVPLGGVVGCQVLQGLEDGFCGCLTTVSTWVTELAALRRRHAYVYGSASVLGTLSIVVVVMGGLRWTDGFAPLQCAT